MGSELVCDLMSVSVRIDSRWSKDYGKDACSPPCLFNIFFAAVLNIVLQRFSEDTVILAELVRLKKTPT